MSKQLLAGITRVLNNDRGPINGMGMVITRRHILTCSHVICSSSSTGPNPKICLDFPLLDINQSVECIVVHDDTVKDIAILELANDLPSIVIPLPIFSNAALWGLHFRVFGFPQGYDQGVWVYGELLERNAAGWVQMIDPKQPGYAIEPGFSGGPVWVDKLNGVVGMVVAADLNTAHKTGYCIPATHLLQVCQEYSLPIENVKEVNYPNTSVNHLQSAYDLISKVQSIFQEPRIFPNECDQSRTMIGKVWDEHVLQAYALLEAAKSLDEDQKILRESLRVSLESVHEDVIQIMKKIAIFRTIAQDTTSETNKQILQILYLLDKLKRALPDVPARSGG